jgi:ubiquinone biosynthesis protein
MVMVEGVASSLDPDINMWDAAGPFVEDWLRDELGPEARIAETLVRGVQTLASLPDLLRRIEAQYPKPGAAPPAPPMPDISIGFSAKWRFAAAALAGGAAALLGQMLIGL